MTIKENKYERKGLKDRVREVTLLSLFILILAASSVILADLIVYPFSVFAINNVTLFNTLFKASFLLILLFSVIIYVRNKISHARKVHETEREAWRYLLKRPLHYIALFMIVLMIIIVTGSVIYLLFSENYHFLYKLGGGK